LELQENFSENYQELLSEETIITGVKVNYYFICETKLWLFSRFLTQEQESELVMLGKIIENASFKTLIKNILIDQRISIDFIKKSECLILHDIKRSSKLIDAHYNQMLYYIWYLKNIKGIKEVKGIINYPKERKRMEVVLNEENEERIVNILQKVKELLSLPQPPKPVYKKYCKKCSYFEFCWSE